MSWMPECLSSCTRAAKTISEWIDMIKVPRKMLGIAKKTLKLVKGGLTGAEILSDLKSGLTSSKACGAYVFLGGSFALTYLNSKTSNESISTFRKVRKFGWEFFEQSRKVTGAYGLLCAASGVAKDPKSYVIPYACALAMFLLAEKS